MNISDAPIRCQLCNAPFPIPENAADGMAGGQFCNRPAHWQAAGYGVVVEGAGAAIKLRAQRMPPGGPVDVRANGSRQIAAAPPVTGGHQSGRPRPPGPEEKRGATATRDRPGDGEPKSTLRRTLRSPRFWILLLALLLLNQILVPFLLPEPNDRVTIPYTVFKTQVAAGNVAEVIVQGDTIQGTFKQPVAASTSPPGQAPNPYTKFTTRIPTNIAAGENLMPLLEGNSVQVTAQPLEQTRSTLVILLLSFGPAVLILGGYLWFSMRAMGGGMFSFGRSRARRYDRADDSPHVTFDDVAGIDEVKHELAEVVDFLKQPGKYRRLGGTIPKGVLLVGPPGTGKTLLARAVAGEAHVPFFSISGSEFIEMIVGVGASRVRDLFAEARKAAPAIIFVDELDAIGRRRGGSNVVGGGANDEREQTLNQLLVEMDGFDAREAVIVLASTNRADVLDPALLRPGRFDRRVTVQPPDRAGRAAILRVHTRGVLLSSAVDLDALAAETPGLVGAELRNLVNEAALLAARNEHDSVGPDEFREALEKIALGTERRLSLLPEERKRVAYHEAGHALLGLLQPEGDPVRRVSVVPRGQALGVTLSVPDDDRYHYSEPYLRARMVNALGGRASEQVVFGTITSGAEDDLKQVTDLARTMVMRWGMSPEVGLVVFSGSEAGDYLESAFGPGQGRPYSEETAQAIDHAIRRIVDECYAKAVGLLLKERSRLDGLVEALLREESLDEAQMQAAAGLEDRRVPQSPISVNR